MTTILHITTAGEWQTAKRKGIYEPASLVSDGFIHCSTVRQVVLTANAYFRGVRDLVLLLIDERATSAAVVYEPPAGAERRADGLFPHLYGPLNLDAVIKTVDFPPSADGTFELPEQVARAVRPTSFQ